MKVFLGLFLLFPALGYAGNAIFENGKPVTLDLGGGRIASLYHARRKPLVHPLNFQVTENTCASPVGMVCQYYGGLGFDTMYAGWAAHPDPKKVLKNLKARPKHMPNGMFADLFSFHLYGSADRLHTPKIAAALPNDRIVCRDYSWLPDGGSTAPESLYVQRWDVELMQTNPQTGLMENSTLGVALGLKLARDKTGGLEIVGAKKYTGSSLSVFAGDIWALILKRPNGDFCQVSLKPNLVGFDKIFIEYLSKEMKHEPYLWGSDEFSTVVKPFYIEHFSKHEDYDIE